MNSKLAVLLLSTALVTMGHVANAETFEGEPAASSLGPGQLSVFAIKSSNGRLAKKRWMMDHWSTWSELSTFNLWSSSPRAVSYTLNGVRYDAVCVKRSGSTIACFTGPNLATYTEPVVEGDPDGSASGPIALGATATADNMTLMLFYVNSNGMLRFRRYFPNINVWGAVQAVPDAPASFSSGLAVSTKDGNPWLIQMCGKATFSNRYWCVLRNDIVNNTSVPWSLAPGVYDVWGSSPAVVINGAGQFRVGNLFGNAEFDNGIWHSSFWVGWSNPTPRGGDVAGGVAAVSWGGDTMHIFGRARFDNNIWYTYYDAGSWAPTWYPL